MSAPAYGLRAPSEAMRCPDRDETLRARPVDPPKPAKSKPYSDCEDFLDHSRRYTADDIKPGDPYELIDGRAMHCMSAGMKHARGANETVGVLNDDPEVELGSCLVDVGIKLSDDTVVAPDYVVGMKGEVVDGWTTEIPPLAVEIAGVGQNEESLKLKIPKLLNAGTRHIWVVRMTGESRVEVHEPGREMRVARRGEMLRAPGILKNDVPVDVFFDVKLAMKHKLRNMMQRLGFDSYEAAQEHWKAEGEALGVVKGRDEGFAEAASRILSRQLRVRFGSAPPWVHDKLRLASREELEAWTDMVVIAPDIERVFN